MSGALALPFGKFSRAFIPFLVYCFLRGSSCFLAHLCLSQWLNVCGVTARYGAMPYEAIKNTDVQAAVRDGTRLEKPESCSPEMYALMHKCWLTNPKLRPTFVELRNTMVQMAKEILAKDPSQRVRDIGASLAKAGAESIYVRFPPSPQVATSCNLPSTQALTYTGCFM